MTDGPLPTRTEAGEETVDLPAGIGFFTTGQVLGERYEVLEMLGRGGMGEVWRAFDLKLRVEVGLKALREELFQSERRLELLRQEVRAAREVVSPNVCRIFDLIEIDGRELVSMEYVDGATLLGVLQERGPLELKEAQDIASQFLSGLEAIHKAGLVHRDVKPENIMLTRAGRVVVMDFGLARGPESGAGSVSGTPAYMAPEHAAGQEVDARADVYSAGVVLAEMVSPEGIRSYESRQSVWEGVRSEPAEVPDSPWAPVIKRAVARDRERRQNSAHTLIRELEDVTLRVEGAEDLHPYPGLASFTEEDAEFFFGREAEVERLWRKLDGPSRLLALVGPSGAGKTSFLQAGLISHAGPGWRSVVSKPGTNPVLGLSRALAPDMAGDVDAMDLLLRFDDPETALNVISRWRQTTDNALIIVDQFEELFTLNSVEEQRRFADLLSRIVLEADVFVLLSMRDDFMMRCRDLETLEPVFSEMTALPALAGGSLRRALVRPATKCGYRFEDDELIEEILAEVEGERGALPMLAFAASRQWEKRDRESGLLTRQAYHDIGGVGGALARHAEATVDRIGVERIPLVRELFRNLVTAEGTRSVREWDELLSVFDGDGREGVKPAPTKNAGNELVGAGLTPARADASDVLSNLIDARLLTSYEVREDEHEPIRRVEIIHESLLANWPRLVRWQTQDQEGAQLRDELRQTAKTWDEHDRTDDYLWTGTAYREFRLWREHYPGGLTEVEEAFGKEMISFAGRRSRNRRLIVATVIFALVAGLAVVGTFWRKSVQEALRAEAQKLVALGQIQIEDYPTSTLAHVTASLELADSEEARILAMDALWRGPTAFVVNDEPTFFASFSPKGDWIVQSRDFTSSLAVISRGGSQRTLSHPTDSGTTRVGGFFGNHEDIFYSGGYATDRSRIALWSARDARMLASAQIVDGPDAAYSVGAITPATENTRAIFPMWNGEDRVTIETLDEKGNHVRLGSVQLPFNSYTAFCFPRISGDWIGTVEGNEVVIVNIGATGLSDRIVLGHHEGELLPSCEADPRGRFLWTFDRGGGTKRWDVHNDLPPTSIQGPTGMVGGGPLGRGSHLLTVVRDEDSTDTRFQIWSNNESKPRLLRTIHDFEGGAVRLDPEGLRLASRTQELTEIRDLRTPVGAEPIALRRGYGGYISTPEFSPDGNWVATCDSSGLLMWPIVRPFSAVIRPDINIWVAGASFTPDGGSLVISADGFVSFIPLDGSVPPPGHTVHDIDRLLTPVALSPDGDFYAVGSHEGKVFIGGTKQRTVEMLPNTINPMGTWVGGFSPNGLLLASLSGFYDIQSAAIQVWNIETREVIATLSPKSGGLRAVAPVFADNIHLICSTSKGLVLWNIETGEQEKLHDVDAQNAVASKDGTRLLVTELGEGGPMKDPAGCPLFIDLESSQSNVLSAHGLSVRAMATDERGTIAVTGDKHGVIRVGSTSGEEPHLLLGHVGAVFGLAVDPRGRWIASVGADNTVRLWPMPDLSEAPLHTLPREELIAKLKTLTNLRVVHDTESATGWTLTHEPFPGWETVPTW